MKKIFALLLTALVLSAGVAFAETTVGTETAAQIAHIYAPIKTWNKGASLISHSKNENGQYVYDITVDVKTLLEARTVLLEAKSLNDARIAAKEAGRGDKSSDTTFVAKRIDTTLGVIAEFLKAKNYVEPTASEATSNTSTAAKK